jgi:hypothetical protein
MTDVRSYAKSIVGAIVAGLASAQQALDDASINAQEGVGIAIATLTALALVWAIPNQQEEEFDADTLHDHDSDDLEGPDYN